MIVELGAALVAYGGVEDLDELLHCMRRDIGERVPELIEANELASTPGP